MAVKCASEKNKPSRARDLMKSRKFWSLFEAHELHPDAMAVFKEIEAVKNVEGFNYRENMTELITSPSSVTRRTSWCTTCRGRCTQRHGAVPRADTERAKSAVFFPAGVTCYLSYSVVIFRVVDLLLFILLLLVCHRVDKVEHGDRKLKV